MCFNRAKPGINLSLLLLLLFRFLIKTCYLVPKIAQGSEVKLQYGQSGTVQRSRFCAFAGTDRC